MAIVFDAHSDILTDIHPRRLLGEREILEKYWIPKMRKGKIDARVVAVYNNSQYLPELALRRALDLIATLYEEIEESPSSVLCKTYADIRRAKEEGKVGLIIGMEGAEPLGSDIQLLRIFFNLGLRVLGLTHALRNYLADGASFPAKTRGQEGGLTDIGLNFLEQAQAMGILIDVSHLNDTGFWDVIKFTKTAIIASHSNCRVLCNHPRNLSDDQIKAIADTGGVVGVNACRSFVEFGDLEHLLNHIDHLVKITSIKHVGLGLDFFEYFIKYLNEAERSRLPIENYKTISGLSDDEDFPKIAKELLRRGYSTSDIELIMGENFLRVFKEILK